MLVTRPEIRSIKDTTIRPLLNRIVRIIGSQLPTVPSEVWLIGSWATLEAVPTSDIDVAILGPARVPAEVMVKIREEIEALPTLRKIDVVDLWDADPHFKQRAISEGERLI